MDSIEERRIGIFEYDWSMYSFIKDFCIKLAESGYYVDIFQKNPNESLNFTNSGEFNNHPRIRYREFKIPNTIMNRIGGKFSGLFGRLIADYKENPKNIIDRKVLFQSAKDMNEAKYICFIGIEKKGLIWAGILSKIYSCPLIYYSLELYIEDHPDIKSYAYLRKAEKNYHQLSAATIIQDLQRAKALYEYNQVTTSELLYFPISVRGDIVKEKSTFIHQKYKINHTKKIVLYYGLIQDARFSTDLISIASQFKDEIMLVLHGFGDRSYLEYLNSRIDKDRVILSLDLVPEEEIIEVISSATIGLALYDNTSLNDRLTAFSSVKVAYYMQCGVPLIAFNSESFRELLSFFECGEVINSIDEIPRKAEKILDNYDWYKQQAFKAYRQIYDFDKNFDSFEHDFDNFIKNKH